MKRRKQRQLQKDRLWLRITGGCDDCDAWTDLIDHGAGVFSLATRHDTTCPYFRSLERQS